jgi:hypothetical protein
MCFLLFLLNRTLQTNKKVCLKNLPAMGALMEERVDC